MKVRAWRDLERKLSPDARARVAARVDAELLERSARKISDTRLDRHLVRPPHQRIVFVFHAPARGGGQVEDRRGHSRHEVDSGCAAAKERCAGAYTYGAIVTARQSQQRRLRHRPGQLGEQLDGS